MTSSLENESNESNESVGAAQAELLRPEKGRDLDPGRVVETLARRRRNRSARCIDATSTNSMQLKRARHRRNRSARRMAATSDNSRWIKLEGVRGENGRDLDQL